MVHLVYCNYKEKILRMRRFFAIFLVIVMTMVLSACSNNTETKKLLNEEGVAPYELSERDTYLLQSLGIQNDANIISFNAPKTAKTLKVNVYVLNDKDTWNSAGSMQMLLNQDDNSDNSSEGTVAMMLKDNHSINININSMGTASSLTDMLDNNNDYEFAISSKSFLTDFQSIELNKEIPIAIMIYDSGNTMISHTMEEFFTPSRFEDMDLVQAVTLIFTDETN